MAREFDREIYAVAEAALNVYLDAKRRAVGTPSKTEVAWEWLNPLGQKLAAVFPAHPELPR